MKFLVTFFIGIASFVYANDWNKVCTFEEYSWLTDGFDKGRIINLQAISPNGDEYFADTKSALVDKKTKTLQIWEIKAISKKTLNYDVQKYGKKYQYDGYSKSLVIYDFSKRRNRALSFVTYDCSGNIIYSSNSNNESEWQYMVPDSVGETKFEILKNHYGF